MKKLLFSIVTMLLPMVASALDSGYCGDNLTWTYLETTRTLTITGSGGMNSLQNNPWQSYKSEIQTVVIEDGVTTIGGYAFQDCCALTSITIPKSVTYIGPRVFYGCTSLASIILPNSLTGIDLATFRDCSALTSISVPSSVTSIKGYAFAGCSALTSVTIPNSVTSIKEYAFSGCNALTSVTISNSLTSIENNVFEQCSSLMTVDIPNSVKSIGNGAFANCSNLTSATIGNAVTSIGHEAFSGCTSLETVTIGDAVKSIESEAFMGCSSLSAVNIPNSVTSIGTSAFQGCSGITTITVGSGNTVFDSRDDCNAIIETSTNKLIVGCSKTTIPNSVTGIDSGAFQDCTNLTSIIIPSSITTFGQYAFVGCRLENVIIRSVDTKLNGYEFSNATYKHAMLYVPVGQRWEAIYGEGGWYQFNNIREIAMESGEVSSTRAYTLMDTKAFNYAVYDAVNNRVARVRSLYDMEEDNPANSWQVVKSGGKSYLYNIGARKYASFSTDGELSLSSTPAPITMQERENGIMIGGNPDQQWAFVLNEKVQADESVTAINGIVVGSAATEAFFSVDGQRISQPKRGVNIIRTSDGQARKVLVK